MIIGLILAIVTVILDLCGCVTSIVLTTIACAFGIMALDYIGAGLFFLFGAFKFYYHDILHWHRPDDSPRRHDGLREHSTCKYCGKDIMQDSQGNWFC